jgi:2-polyprenyl-6-methoxyphenol hydroxylase-like FAD-dependent oxidoreductase
LFDRYVAIDIGISNRDERFNVLIKRPDNPDGFSIRSSADARRFLDGSPPLLRRHIDGLVDHLIASPLRRFKYARSEKWAFRCAALVGDAARCFPPYLGQSLNAGLHDGTSFANAFDAARGDWDQILARYQTDCTHRAPARIARVGARTHPAHRPTRQRAMEVP